MAKAENGIGSNTVGSDASKLSLNSIFGDTECSGAETFGQRLLCEIGWSKPPSRNSDTNIPLSKNPYSSDEIGLQRTDGSKDGSGLKAGTTDSKLTTEEVEFQKALEDIRDPGAKYARLSGEQLGEVLRSSDGKTALETLWSLAGPERSNERSSKYDRFEFTHPERLKQSLDKLSEAEVVALFDKMASAGHRSSDSPFSFSDSSSDRLPKVEPLVIDYWKNTYLIPNSEPATADDYKAWLKGHLANGGKVSHQYDYSMSGIRVLKRDMELPALNAGFAVNAIVPGGIDARFYNESKHSTTNSNLYYMDGFRASGTFVPLYSNIK